MTAPHTAPLTSTDLVALAHAHAGATPCGVCESLVCPGWESMPGSFDRAGLECVGTLRDAANEDPTVAEYHPDGTNAWSADAPIAIGWFPYNRCDAWRCATCRRPFLRYTEYGGYYTDERIREIDAARVADAPPPP